MKLQDRIVAKANRIARMKNPTLNCPTGRALVRYYKIDLASFRKTLKDGFDDMCIKVAMKHIIHVMSCHIMTMHYDLQEMENEKNELYSEIDTLKAQIKRGETNGVY